MRLSPFWHSRRGRWTVGAVLLLLTLWGALSWITRRRVYRTVESSEAVLDSAGLVAGVTVARVQAVLDSIHAVYAPLATNGSMGARIGPSFQDFVVSGDIYAEFKFDSTGHLLSRQVRERLTGP